MLVNLCPDKSRSVRPLGTCQCGTVILKDGNAYLVIDSEFSNGTSCIDLSSGEKFIFNDECDVRVLEGEFNEFTDELVK